MGSYPLCLDYGLFVQVGIESIGTMPSLVAFPFFPILAEAIFLFGWVSSSHSSRLYPPLSPCCPIVLF
jgi:hypothetical protein